MSHTIRTSDAARKRSPRTMSRESRDGVSNFPVEDLWPRFHVERSRLIKRYPQAERWLSACQQPRQHRLLDGDKYLGLSRLAHAKPRCTNAAYSVTYIQSTRSNRRNRRMSGCRSQRHPHPVTGASLAFRIPVGSKIQCRSRVRQ
jgi:hypothetical protein